MLMLLCSLFFNIGSVSGNKSQNAAVPSKSKKRKTWKEFDEKWLRSFPNLGINVKRLLILGNARDK